MLTANARSTSAIARIYAIRVAAARAAALASLLGAVTGIVAPGAQAAEGFGCRASALRLTQPGTVALEPAVANGPATPCATQATTVFTLPSAFGSVLSLTSATAHTTSSPYTSDAQSGVVSPQLTGALGGIKVTSLTAQAHEGCSGGTVTTSSSSQVVGLTVNGTAYGTVSESLSLPLPGVGTLYVNRTVQEGEIVTQRALELSMLPSAPGGLAGADLVLAEASASAICSSDPVPPKPGHTSAVEEAGEPEVMAGSFAGRQAAAAWALKCTRRGVVLIDVLIRHHRVSLLGAADGSLIGHRVAIKLLATHRRVAVATVGPDGLFATTAPLPSARVRYTNRALYQATVAGLRSQALKLVRRMHVTSISAANGRVVMRGRVSLPLGRPIATILVQRRVTCTSAVTVARIKPKPDGRFSVALPAPPHTLAGVYQARTRVRGYARSRATYPTISLPREVVLE